MSDGDIKLIRNKNQFVRDNGQPFGEDCFEEPFAGIPAGSCVA
ncbi:MAG: hypothetical protein WAR81_07865 [Pseudomonadales bacterium]